jgi:diketogulonate reductase-like aldo/keto reductase
MHGYPEWLSTPDLLVEMSDRYPNTTTAQILLRWALQRGFLIIPKSSRQERIVENGRLFHFELSDEDMRTLDHWGSNLTDEERNLYKRDWNWNPIDEASVRVGRTHFWPNYEGVRWDDEAEQVMENEL